MGVDEDTGTALVVTGIEQSDGTFFLFTDRYGQSAVLVEMEGAGGGEEQTPADPYALLNVTLVDTFCSPLMTITNGATYTLGEDFPNVPANIKFEFADNSLIRETRTNHRQHDLAGNIRWDRFLGWDNANRDNFFLVRSDFCDEPQVWSIANLYR